MAELEVALLANVTEGGDIVLFALALIVALVVGVILYWIDLGVGRLHQRARRRPSPERHRAG